MVVISQVHVNAHGRLPGTLRYYIICPFSSIIGSSHLIHSFSQSTCECVKYYYVSKKSENFKQLARKASFKRKKTFVKSTEMLTLPCSNHTLSTPPHSMLLDSKQDSLTGVKPPSGTHTHINTANSSLKVELDQI